jgi:hypothetical protein
VKFRVFFLLLLAAGALAAEPKKAPKGAIPYLGPGSDKLSAEKYQQVYKNYIQTSILLGYPFFKERAPACEQALSSIFRNAGMFGYPVPAEAQQIQRSTKTFGPRKVETYEMAGVIIQIARVGKTKALEQLVLVNSSSTRAIRRLSASVKKELLVLDRDPVTGLERVHGIPVGYPHPYLTTDGQGLYVKILRFNGKVEGCQPLGFQDNAWVGGYDLSEARCTELQTDAERVWSEKISPEDFSQHELKRMKDLAMKSALAKGSSEAEAQALIEKHFTLPLTNEINIVGSAMRNLAECNLLALGRAGGAKAEGAADGGTASPGAPGAGTGTAK